MKISDRTKVVNYRDYDIDYLYDEKTEEYYSHIDAMEGYYRFKGLEMPRYAYGCYFESISLDIDDMLEYACQDHHEDIMDDIEGYKELKIAVEKFNEMNKSNGSYFIDYDTVVELF